MKRPSYIYILEILLFFVLLAGAFLMLSPVSKKLDEGIADIRKIALEKLESETGLTFSYSSLSPSILRSLKFKDLVVRDALSGAEIARVSEVSITYSLREILAGNPAGALREIVVRNGIISLDTEANRSVFDRFSRLSSGPSATDGRNKTNSSVKIRLSNIAISYHDRDFTLFGTAAKGSASLAGDEIAFSLGGKIAVNHPKLSFSPSSSADIELNGSLSRSFDSGTASLVFRNLQSGRVSVNRVGLVTSFRNGIVTVSSAGSLQPVDVNVVWDIAKESVTGTFECEKLFPFKWIRIRNIADVMPAGLENSVLSGSASIVIGKNLDPEYSLDFVANVPESVEGGGVVSVACKGNLENVDFSKFSIAGSRYDLSYTGSFDLVKHIPSGFASVRKIKLTEGCIFAGEMYLQPDKNGFTCLVPELHVSDSVFSSVELAVVPQKGQFGLSLSAYDSSGHISSEGTFSIEKVAFLELHIALDSANFSNTAGLIAKVISPRTDFSGILKQLSHFALTTEMYLSTDFSDVSFSCNRLVLASADKDGFYLILSGKGNVNGVDLTNITFSLGGYDITGNIYSSFESTGILFNTNFAINSIPYSASGSWSDNSLSLYGDYGLALSAIFGQDGRISGSFSSRGLPVPVGPFLTSLSLDAGFNYLSASDWKIVLNDGSIEEMKNVLPLPTEVSFSGAADPSGLKFSWLTVSDSISKLEGRASLSVLPDSTYRTQLQLASTESKESINLDGSCSFASGTHFDLKADLVDVPLMRFVKGQQPSSLVSLSLAASGTPEKPVVSADIRKCVYRLGDFDLTGVGGFRLENNIARLVDATVSWDSNTFSALNVILPLDSFKAHAESDYASTLGNSGLSARLALDLLPASGTKISDIRDVPSILNRFSVSASISDGHWRSFSFKDPFAVSFVHEPGVTAIYAGKDDAITGFLLDDGTFSLQSGASLPVTFHADGEVVRSNLSIRVDGFHTDLAVLWPLVGTREVEFASGKLDGNFVISGLLNDPEFRGSIHAGNIVVRAPGFLAGTYGPAAFDIIAEGKTLSVPAFTLDGKEGAATASATVTFDRWIPSNVEVHVATLPGKPLKVLATNDLFKASGYASCNLNILATQDLLSVDGATNLESGSFSIMFSNFTAPAKTSVAPSMDYKVNLALNFGKKVEFRWPTDDFPIIRGLVQAEKPIDIAVDTQTNSFSVKGSANLKGGEIFYIKRSFYLRKGTITLDGNQDKFDPMISARAEIRERDENGDPVKILLTVENQPLSTFTPVLSSDPPKSDVELMALLGQATSADATRKTILKDTVVTASDILTQISLFRSAENSIRDLFGLDIFSIRTLIVQNAIFGPSMQGMTADKNMTIGNYFDNTTVYMGKYLGSAIYADALMHFTYYDPLASGTVGTAQVVYQNLLFQPELGLEMATPFCLVRWSIAPAHPDTLFVSDNSITLSWKFSY